MQIRVGTGNTVRDWIRIALLARQVTSPRKKFKATNSQAVPVNTGDDLIGGELKKTRPEQDRFDCLATLEKWHG